MDMGGSTDPAAMQAAFDALARLLGESGGRERVRADLESALREEGADPAYFPGSLLETVAGLTDDEMAMVSQIQGRFGDAFPEHPEVCIIF
jgi:hypothetical protein